MKIRQYIKRVATLALMVALLAPLQDAWGQTEGFDTYFSWPVSLTSSVGSYETGHGDDKAVDGDPATWMESVGTDNVSLMVINEERKPIKRLAFDLGGNYYKRAGTITIEAMDDQPDASWKDIATITNSSHSQNVETVLDTPITDPYIRLTFSGANSGYVVNEVYFYVDLSGYAIQHKTEGNKWHDLYQENDKDRFEDDVKSFTIGEGDNAIKIQPAHAVVDTIYAYPGQIITLYSPDINNYYNANNRTYQRWYNYKTDGVFPDGMLRPLDGLTGYKLENGYVGYPLTHGEENGNLYAVQFTMPEEITADNQEFIVACDVSIYTDYDPGEFKTADENSTETTINAFIGENGQCYEPTIGHRLIYYVRSIDRPSDVTYDENNPDPFSYRDRVNKVQAGTLTYAAEYTIHFPNKHVSKNTPEVLGLRMDALNYKLPNPAIENTPVSLTVAIEGESNDINLRAPGDTGSSKSITLSGRDRFFYLIYPENDITDGATTVITVKNGTTNLIKYNIIFDAGTELLTESQLGTYDPENATNNNPNAYRTEEYLKAKYGEPFTELNFDYDQDNATYGKQVKGYSYYPFPMPWESSSYGFHDGGPNRTFSNNTALDKDVFTVYDSNTPVWGYYAFTSADGRTENGTKRFEGLGYDGNTYYMSADLSDRPGVIAQLPFREALCPGAELFVTAWVNTPHAAYQGNADVGIRFSIMGREIGDDGTKGPWTSIYSHNSGQITKRDWEGTQITGNTDGEWQQLYFSFINGDAEDAYDEYCLQLENVSSSTIGADLFLDKIQVFMATPSAVAEQKRVECEERTMLNFRINWDQLHSRLGGAAATGNGAIDFCLLDTLKYREVIPYGKSGDVAKAIKASAVWIGNNLEGAENYYNRQYGTLYYKWDFSGNKLYNDEKEDCLAANNNIGTQDAPQYGFYRLTDEENDENYLAVDIQAELVPTRTYWLLIKDHTLDLASETFASSFDNPDDKCAMRSVLSIEGQNLVKINGEVVTEANLDSYCTGQSFTFSVDMRPLDASGATTVTEDIYFDWFFGEREDFEAYYTIGTDGKLTESSAGEGVSLEEALSAFRDIEKYKDKTDLEGVTASEDDNLTDAHIALIKYYLDQYPAGEGLNHQLVLCRQTLDIRLLESGLDLVVVPINPEPTDTEVFCFMPSYLHLSANGKAPQVQPGFGYVDYKNEDYNPAMRIGLKQIEASATNSITVNLRNAAFAYDENDLNKPADYNPEILEQINEDQKGHGYIYLVGSDDPAYANLFNDEEMDMHQYEIGIVESLSAKPSSTTPDDNKMTIKFDLTGPMESGGNAAFDPKEGYSYTMHIHVEEKGDGITSCYGNMNLVMKVVPEYLEWAGKEASDNWHEDTNWKRILSGRINKTQDTSSDYFTDGSNKSEKAYVPMLFTKVIMPKDSKVELYKAGFSGTPTGSKNMSWDSERPNHIDPPEIVDVELGQPIYYDMMVYSALGNNTDMTTQPFRVSLLNQIHFEPGAEMKHAEYLLYDTAWVDYQLDKGRWYTLASPLKAVYAGDFYTDISGTEGNEYFQPIYYSERDNNRFNPSVYQRAWKGSATLQMLDNETKDVAISGNWSALYNDVDEAYTPGTGFSLKVQDITGNATFRLPKADGSYKYYPHGDGQSGNETSVSRVEGEGTENVSGRLKTDAIMNRKVVGDATLYTSFTVPLADEHGGYYLVGNPFMAHLDMKKFFDGNTGLVRKYWVVDNNSQKVAVGTEEDITTTDPTGDATVAPLQSFFVQKADNATNNTIITFSQDMQVLGDAATGGESSGANALILTATTGDGRQSRAAVAYSGMASDDYQSSEDAELFLDSNLGDVPMVYTVAGTMATSINVRQNCELVPLGVYGTDDEPVTLRFDQVDAFSGVKLYDAQAKRYTTLTEGSEVSVSTNDYGRYYLTGGLATGSEAIRTVDDISIYSVRPGEIVATSAGSSLRSVRVYGIGGELVTQQSLANQSVYRLRVPGNAIYVVYAEDMDGIIRNVKLRVR